MLRTLSLCTLLWAMAVLSGCGRPGDVVEEAPPDMQEEAMQEMMKGQEEAMKERQKARQAGPPRR